MLRITRYITLLFLILLCLFTLHKYNVDVQGYVAKATDNMKLFFDSIKNSPAKSPDEIFTEIKSTDMVGALGATTTASTTPTTAVKGYTEEPDLQKPQTTAKISIDGIIYYTNIERKKAGLAPLTKSAKLNTSATEKIDDMFSQQYFEHESPDGKTAADLVKEKGYDFQIVGENLALGVFQTDQALVQAWMNSPAHRANILNPKFTEMGAAVGVADYKGQREWMAVQHFAKPLPVCKPVDEIEQKNIDTEKASLESDEVELQKMAGVIETDPDTASNKEYLNNYNTKVSNYNARLNSLRTTIETFNQTIVEYNACVKA